MNNIIYTKICMILTIGFAGLNIHQFLASYEYIKNKVNEFKSIIKDDKDLNSLNWVSYIFYFILPALYLIILTKASFSYMSILLLGVKLFLSGMLGLWTQKQVFIKPDYSKSLHYLGKADNFLNIGVFFLVAYLLIFQV